MPQFFRAGFFTILIISVISSFVLSGCPAPKETQPDQPDQPVIEEPVEIDDPIEPETVSAGGDDGIVSGNNTLFTRDGVAEEDLDGMEALFGSFIYPEAVFMPDSSMVQRFGEGSAIYQLGFSTTSPIDVVSIWFTENVEDGTDIGDMQLPAGSTVYSYNYKAPDDSYTKIITVSGFVNEARCQIGVNLTHAGGLSDSDDESE